MSTAKKSEEDLLQQYEELRSKLDDPKFAAHKAEIENDIAMTISELGFDPWEVDDDDKTEPFVRGRSREEVEEAYVKDVWKTVGLILLVVVPVAAIAAIRNHQLFSVGTWGNEAPNWLRWGIAVLMPTVAGAAIAWEVYSAKLAFRWKTSAKLAMVFGIFDLATLVVPPIFGVNEQDIATMMKLRGLVICFFVACVGFLVAARISKEPDVAKYEAEKRLEAATYMAQARRYETEAKNKKGMDLKVRQSAPKAAEQVVKETLA